MYKEEFIKRRGEAAYKKRLQQRNDWNARHRGVCNARTKDWCTLHPDEVKAYSQEQGCKGGKRYGKKLKYQYTGLQGERNKIRYKHWRKYRIIRQATPSSQIHHEWIPGTAKYRGVALVDKELHMRGIIKVIKVLEDEITIFTEKEIRVQEVC